MCNDVVTKPNNYKGTYDFITTSTPLIIIHKSSY